MHKLAALMATQFGVVGREQALMAGLGPRAIKHRLSTGEWFAIHPGVYRLAAMPGSWRQRAMGALFAAGNGGALSHFSAAYVLGIPALNEREPSVIEVSVPRTRRMRLHGVRAHSPREEVSSFKTRDGLRTTTLARTFIDLAGVLDEERLEFALDSAAVKNPRLMRWLEVELESLHTRGRRGLERFAQLLELRRDGERNHRSK